MVNGTETSVCKADSWRMTQSAWNEYIHRNLTPDEVRRLKNIIKQHSVLINTAKLDGRTVYQSRNRDRTPASEWEELTETGREGVTVDEHKSAVEAAIRAGKPVPAEVRSAYSL